MRFIGYGAMLMESFVAVMALIAASIIDPGLYYAMNAPAGVVGDTVAVGLAGCQRARLPDHSGRAARRRPRRSRRSRLVARTGGAPTLAIGMSQIFSGATGDSLKAFWYHFAIMFEALFILTTVDAGTRVGRFMLQDTLGNVWKPIGRVSWKPGLWATSAVVVGAWGYFLYTGVTNPLGGINQLFPLFGIANQLLAAVALTVATTLLIKCRQARVGLGDRRAAGVGRGGHPDGELPEDVLRRPEAGLLRPARPVRGRDRRTARSWRRPRRSDDMNAVVTNSTVDGDPRRAVRDTGHRRDPRRVPDLDQGDPGARAAADDGGSARAVADLRAGRPVHERRGPRGAGGGRERRRHAFDRDGRAETTPTGRAP